MTLTYPCLSRVSTSEPRLMQAFLISAFINIKKKEFYFLLKVLESLGKASLATLGILQVKCIYSLRIRANPRVQIYRVHISADGGGRGSAATWNW